ncbi:hypothetical protein EMIHUDRAFT_446031, partial [Emiliania huxleyi CCMP1516]|uniref:HTTM domain-containing protein n=2 Tax=Emiliania huxleyi TaxID=2903 RepID=A0A0D3IL33_EMIH1
MTTPGQRPFSAYVRLWAIANLLRISIGLNAGTGLVGSTLDANFFSLATLPALVALAGLVPARWSGALPLVALVARAATNAAKGSMMSNSQMWATQMDAALVLSLLRRLGSAARHGSSWSSPLSAEDERAVVGGCARTVRWQLAIFYFASGFWKANTSFLHPSYSCAGLFMVQPLEYLPDDVLFAASGLAASAVPALARAIAATGPAFTLVLEAVVPVLHFLEPRRFPRCALFGLVLTLAFHLVIGLTPPPSNVSTYGVTTCTRLFFVFPDAAAAAVGEMGRPHTAAGALLCAGMAAAAAATLALVEPYHAVAISTVQGEGKDWHAGWYAALAVLLTRAAVLEAAGGEEGEGSVCGAPLHAPGRLRAGGRRRRGGVRQRGRSSRGEGEEPRGGGEDEGGACFAGARRARAAVRLRAARGGAAGEGWLPDVFAAAPARRLQPPPAPHVAAAARARLRRADERLRGRRGPHRGDGPRVGRKHLRRAHGAAHAPADPRGGGRARRVRLGGQVEFRQAEPPAAAVSPPHPLRARPAPAARDGGAAEGLLLAPVHAAARRRRRRGVAHRLGGQRVRGQGRGGRDPLRAPRPGWQRVAVRRAGGGADRSALVALVGLCVPARAAAQPDRRRVHRRDALRHLGMMRGWLHSWEP